MRCARNSRGNLSNRLYSEECKMATFQKIAKKGDVPPGSGKVIEAGGKEIALFNCDGQFYAINNVCVHQGGPLGEGYLEGTVVTCPWHGWQYDVTNGVSPVESSIRTECYPIKVEGEDILVSL